MHEEFHSRESHLLLPCVAVMALPVEINDHLGCCRRSQETICYPFALWRPAGRFHAHRPRALRTWELRRVSNAIRIEPAEVEAFIGRRSG